MLSLRGHVSFIIVCCCVTEHLTHHAVEFLVSVVFMKVGNLTVASLAWAPGPGPPATTRVTQEIFTGAWTPSHNQSDLCGFHRGLDPSHNQSDPGDFHGGLYPQAQPE